MVVGVAVFVMMVSDVRDVEYRIEDCKLRRMNFTAKQFDNFVKEVFESPPPQGVKSE